MPISYLKDLPYLYLGIRCSEFNNLVPPVLRENVECVHYCKLINFYIKTLRLIQWTRLPSKGCRLVRSCLDDITLFLSIQVCFALANVLCLC